MNILIVTQRWYPDTFGGSEHVAAEQARRLALRGHTVHVVTQRVREVLPLVEKLPLYPPLGKGGNGGVLTIHRYGSPKELTRLGGLSRTDLREVPKLTRRLTKAIPFDCAILHHPFAAHGFFCAKPKLPALYLFHTSTAREAEVEGIRYRPALLLRLASHFLTARFIAKAARVERKVFKRAKQIAVLSDFSRLILEGAYPFTQKKIIKLPIGIDLMGFTPSASPLEARRKLGLDPQRTLLLTVRRFTPRMGLTELIVAFEKVLTEVPAAQLLIVGEGPLKETLATMIKEKKLSGKVTLIGAVPVEELPLYYQAVNLFVLPTAAFEGLGMATLEALACGLPVVGTPAGATLEVLGALDPSLVTRGINAEEIAEGILGFLKRPETEQAALRKRAREVAVEQYDWERAIDELEQVLEQLHNQAAKSRRE